MGRAGRIVAVLAGVLVLVLVLAQLLLPGLAAGRISSRVGRYGSVRSVSVSAWPAVKLLWGKADSVHVDANSLSLTPAQTAALLWEARGADSLQVSAANVQEGTLRLSDARLSKHGSTLSAEALAGEASVRAALPEGLGVQLLRSEGGQVEVRASGRLFGVGASVDAVAGASEGKLVAHPLGLLVEGLRLTLFSDPHVYVQAVGASVQPGTPRTYRLTMRASLR